MWPSRSASFRFEAWRLVSKGVRTKKFALSIHWTAEKNRTQHNKHPEIDYSVRHMVEALPVVHRLQA